MIDYSVGIYLIMYGQLREHERTYGLDGLHDPERVRLVKHMEERFESFDLNKKYYIKSVIDLFKYGN